MNKAFKEWWDTDPWKAIPHIPSQEEMAELAYEAAIPKWQPISAPPKTNTPEIKINLLAFDSIVGVIAAHYQDGHFYSSSSNTHREWITHWQPLPEPPK